MVLVALALYLVLNAVLGRPGANGLVDLAGLRGDALATLFYVANWHAIYAHQSYFAQFSTPSPLQHTWSLAIEEQFYLVWPPVLLMLLAVARAAWRRAGLVVTVAGTLASAALMALLFHRGCDPTRVYFGTDTRSFDLMAGATVAFSSAARPQPGPPGRRALHIAAPAAAAVLGVFWVTAGTPGGVPRNWMFQGGFLLAAALAAVVIADARLFDRGPFARAPLGPAAALPRHHLLRGLPLALADLRLPHRCPDRAFGRPARRRPVGGNLADRHSQLLPGRAPDPSRQAPPPDAGLVGAGGRSGGGGGRGGRDDPGDRRADARRRHLSGRGRRPTARRCDRPTPPAAGTAGTGRTAQRRTGRAAAAASAGPAGLTGTGGYLGQLPIRLPARPVISHRHPLRVMLIGDSVMHDASFGIVAALSATGEVEVATNTIDGFGLVNATNWRTSIPLLIRTERPQLIIGTWSWDEFGPTSPNALHQPAQYTALLRQRHADDAQAGRRSRRRHPPPVPAIGGDPVHEPGRATCLRRRARQGQRGVERHRRQDAVAVPRPRDVPAGRRLVLLHGRFSSWLPPPGVPQAPKNEWVRVRKLDNVHLCPEGSARYGEALLVDLTTIFRLAPASGDWSRGAWVSNPDFNTPPGACPDDHPPG